MDEEVARSGKAIFLLHTPEDAAAFWREPAKAKFVTMYMNGCSWCTRFMPELIKLAPTVANSDLLIGALSKQYMNNVTQFVPALQVQGYPTSILVDEKNQIRQVIAGYQPIDQLIVTIETHIPELRHSPNLQYLNQFRPASNPAAILPSQRQGRKGGGGGGVANVVMTNPPPAEFVAGSGVTAPLGINHHPLNNNNKIFVPPPPGRGTTAVVLNNNPSAIRHPPARAVFAQHPKSKPQSEKRVTPPKSAGAADPNLQPWCTIM